MQKKIADLDKWFPPIGQCGLCGHPDARHRLWDAFIGFAGAGESAEGIAKWYDNVYPVEGIKAVLEIQPYQDDR